MHVLKSSQLIDQGNSEFSVKTIDKQALQRIVDTLIVPAQQLKKMKRVLFCSLYWKNVGTDLPTDKKFLSRT